MGGWCTGRLVYTYGWWEGGIYSMVHTSHHTQGGPIRLVISLFPKDGGEYAPHGSLFPPKEWRTVCASWSLSHTQEGYPPWSLSHTQEGYPPWYTSRYTPYIPHHGTPLGTPRTYPPWYMPGIPSHALVYAGYTLSHPDVHLTRVIHTLRYT